MLSNREQEIREALDAGYRTLNALTECENCLQSARSFGIWDIFGGNFVSGMMKHSRLDDAKRAMETAKYELGRFQKELGDVTTQIHLSITVGTFGQLADFFFDNLLVDLLIQSKIKQSLSQVQQLKVQVESIVRQLRNMQ